MNYDYEILFLLAASIGVDPVQMGSSSSQGPNNRCGRSSCFPPVADMVSLSWLVNEPPLLLIVTPFTHSLLSTSR